MRALAAEGKGLVLLGKLFLASTANGTDPVIRQVFKGNVVVLGRVVFIAAHVTYVLHEILLLYYQECFSLLRDA